MKYLCFVACLTGFLDFAFILVSLFKQMLERSRSPGILSVREVHHGSYSLRNQNSEWNVPVVEHHWKVCWEQLSEAIPYQPVIRKRILAPSSSATVTCFQQMPSHVFLCNAAMQVEEEEQQQPITFPPNNTIYIKNLNDKARKSGEWPIELSRSYVLFRSKACTLRDVLCLRTYPWSGCYEDPKAERSSLCCVCWFGCCPKCNGGTTREDCIW